MSVKKEKLVTKIFCQLMLNEVLKIFEKLSTDVKANVKQ